MKLKNYNINVFEKNIKEYDEWYNKNKEIFKLEIKAIKKLIKNKNIKKSLEIGCGTGRFSKALNISEAIEPSKKLANYSNKLGVKTKIAYAENLPYKANVFDMVLIAFVLEFLKDSKVAIKEVFRVLKEKGIFIIVFLNKDAINESKYKKKKFYRNAKFFKIKEVLKMIKTSGFKVVKKLGITIIDKKIANNNLRKSEVIFISANKGI